MRPSGEYVTPKTVDVQALRLPWGAWYAETEHSLIMPGEWEIDVLQAAGAPPLSQANFIAAIRSPLGTEPLQELARGCRTACVAVDDLARPTRTSDLLPIVIRELQAAGINDEAISIVVATGTHGPPPVELLRAKVGGELPERIRVECHRPEISVPCGVTYGNQPLRLNETFLKADLKLAIGCVLPHPFAAYSGGAKMVIPGLSDIQAAKRSHKFVQMGLRGGNNPDENRFRTEIETLAIKLGLRFVLCAVVNGDRRTVGLFAGHPVAAHRAACRMASRVFATSVKKQYDVAFVNAYPKDIDLIQSRTAFGILRSGLHPLVHENGLYILSTAASEGLGRHGLFGPGGACYQPPRRLRILAGRDAWIYAPSVSREEAARVFWSGYRHFQTREALLGALKERFGHALRMAVVPNAPMQKLHTIDED